MRERALTEAEWSALSPGLAAALQAAGVCPRLRARAHPAARVAAAWFGAIPIMAVGRTIWWPGAAADFAGGGATAVLQHELQHLLDFAEGRLTVLGYLTRPRNWRYAYALAPGLSWDDLGAEQRASAAEDLWRAERSANAAHAAALKALIPWAR